VPGKGAMLFAPVTFHAISQQPIDF